MKSCLFILLLLISSATCAAQCVSKNVIALHDLRLGMSPVEARSVLGLKIKIKKSGERTFFQNFIKDPPPRTLPDARALYLRFFEGRLYQIEIFYENRAGLQTLEDFTKHLSSTMNLNAAWETKNGRSEIKCPEFSLVADNILNPRIEITDEVIRAQVRELRKKK